MDFEVNDGEIVGLIGPNGSGKTTLFNVVTGIYGADEGAVTFAGKNMTTATPQAIYRAGITRTFQRSRMCLPLSVFDNIMVGNHKRLNHGLVFNLLRRDAFAAELARNRQEARELVQVFSPALAERMEEPAAGMPMIDRRRIEICCALITGRALCCSTSPPAGMTHGGNDPLGRHPAPCATASRPDHRHHRARDGRDRARHRPLRGAQLRPQDQGRHVRGGCRRSAGAGSLSRTGVMAGLLEILDVTTAYDKADVLQGISLTVEAAASPACSARTAPARPRSSVRSSA